MSSIIRSALLLIFLIIITSSTSTSTSKSHLRNKLKSFQDFLNNYLLNFSNPNSGKMAKYVCERALIIGNQDGELWASSTHLALEKYKTEVDTESGSNIIEVNEFANLVDVFNNSGISKIVGGVRINRVKFFVVNFDAENNILTLKKNGGGAVVAKSNQTFIIGVYSSSKFLINFDGIRESQNVSMTSSAVGELQKFFLENDI